MSYLYENHLRDVDSLKFDIAATVCNDFTVKQGQLKGYEYQFFFRSFLRQSPDTPFS